MTHDPDPTHAGECCGCTEYFVVHIEALHALIRQALADNETAELHGFGGLSRDTIAAMEKEVS